MASNLNVTELDFDEIKKNLKNFLKAQNEFTDHDFEGSGLNVLLDVLSYNTHYNAVAAHYSLNEAFLDSAQIRGNVVTRAKLLGYTPRSVLSPRATVNVVVDATNESGTRPGLIILKRGSKFTSEASGITYDFSTLENVSANLDTSTNTYTFTNVKLAEGRHKSLLYRVDNDIENQKFQLSDKDADTSTLRVRVQENEQSTSYQVYTKFETLLTVDSASQVYYLQENPNGYYEVYFGDGVTGKKPVNDNIVTVDYVYTHGEEANGASVFTHQDTIVGLTTESSVTTTTVSNASGGTIPESIDSIRFNAPLTFTSQGRAVTSEDYKSIILKSFSNISSISTWGGEDNDPVDFGSVYVAIKPLTAQTLSASEKLSIKETILKGKNVVSITPEIVDPNFTYLELDVFFKFNPNLTDRTAAELESLIKDVIADYNFNNLNKFDGVLRHSQLLKFIDQSDPSILNSTVRPYMFQNIIAGQSKLLNNFNLSFAAPFYESGNSTDFILNSSAFKLETGGADHYFGDISITNSANRQIIIYKIVDGQNITVENNCGIITPSTGKITLFGFGLPADNTTIKLTLTPNSLDIAPKRDQLLDIDNNAVSVNAQIDTISTAGSSGSINYNVNSRLR
tara:strand:- start:7153 stop:9024 length:1872 start_codon:yes stop_codon:yes gene_type:complete